MSKFQPKSFPQLVGSMAAKVTAETPITDFSDGSVILTLLETAAQEDFQQYIQMLNIIRNYNLDTTEGEDLDKRALEYGLTRRQAIPHSGFVTIKDNSFVKIASKIYSGLPGPIAGTQTINVDDASLMPTSGMVYIGRTTVNSEGPFHYSVAPVNNVSHWTITLDTVISRDHGTDETVILGQGGSRVVDSGTEVEVPETDASSKILFELNQTVELLDGEDTLPNVLVTALQAGAFRVPANSIVSFPNQPFTDAAVTNPAAFVNGKDLETDQELRDRIRTTIQSLSRGTSAAIRNAILNLIDQESNSSVVSANIVPPVVLADGPTKVFIDNGRGLEPSLKDIGVEQVITNARGGEKFFQAQNFPIVKASLISQSVETFNLSGGETLIYSVGTDEETFTFLATDFENLTRARATEIAQAVNKRSILLEARTITDAAGKKIMLTPKALINEDIKMDSSSTAQAALNFTTLTVSTSKLYKNDKLLTKDGVTASVLSLAQPFNIAAPVFTTTDSDITVSPNSTVVSKSAPGSNPFLPIISDGDYIKFSTDASTFYMKVRTVVSDTKLILELPYPSAGGGVGNIDIWRSQQLEIAANGDQDHTDLIAFGPNDSGNPIQALATEVYNRIATELNIASVELAVNDTKIKLVSDLKNNARSQIQVLGGGASISLGFCSAQAINGTITVTGGGKTVTGVGTNFLTDIQRDQWIKADVDGVGSWTKVESIESDTIMYLYEGYRGLSHASVAASKILPGKLAIGSDKDYTLNRSNGQIELTNPLVAGDNLTLGSVNTRAFVDSIPETYSFTPLGPTSNLIVAVDGGFAGTVSSGDAIPPYDTFIDTSLQNYPANIFNGFYIQWVSGVNTGQAMYVSSYNSITGQIILTAGTINPINIGDKYVLCQVLTFTNVTDFVNPLIATAQEVANAINKQLLGGVAEVLSSKKVRIRSSNFGDLGKIEIKGGNANTVLGFTLSEQENQLSNVAFVTTENSDRNFVGFPSYTLGPDQNLIFIFDGNSATKTFAVNPEIKGTVDSVGVGIFADSNVGTDYITPSHFNDYWLYWTGGSNAGSVQYITSYSGLSGTFTASDVFPATLPNPIVNGDTFSLVPRTAKNVADVLNDLKVTTLSIVSEAEVTGITGDVVQVATKTPGSEGKVFVTGGTANSLGISVTSIPSGPGNQVDTDSKAGLAAGLYVYVTADGTVTTGDNTPAFDTFIDTSMISTSPAFFNGMDIEFLTGNNKGIKTSILSYNNVTGQIVLSPALPDTISIGDTYRIRQPLYVKAIAGVSAPYTIDFVDATNTPFTMTEFTPSRASTIRDVNGLKFPVVQAEGVDGYKYFTNLIQKVQWTIDGLDRDPTTYPGYGAAGTQFEVIPPVLIRVKLELNVVPDQGTSLSAISDSVATAVEQYVNSRGVSEDVVLSEIIAVAQSVNGVFDVHITNLTENIIVADSELARLDAADLSIG